MLQPKLDDVTPVIVGSIGAPHGVRGWVRINSYTEPSDNLFSYPLLLESGKNNWQPIAIEQVQPHGKGFVAKLEKIEDRDQAALITNLKLGVQRSDFPELEADEHYWADILGLTVFNQDGVQLGKVVDFFTTGANDVIVVRDAEQEHLIPYVPDMYVVDVNIADGTMQVRWDLEF